MPHDKRKRVNMSDFDVEVRAQITDIRTTLHISATGTDHVLWRLEMILPPDGFVHTEGLIVPAEANGWAILNGPAEYHRGAHSIIVKGGSAIHGNARELRGGEPPAPDSFTLYFTGYTPMQETITLEARTSVPDFVDYRSAKPHL